VGGLLIIVILFVAVWLLFVLPARRRRSQHAAMQDSVETGHEIITAGGLHGRVVADEGDTVRVEVAPGVVVTLDRRAIAAVATEVEVEAEAAPDLEEPEEAAAAPGEPGRETPAKPR
jgi:preprotein translocase subunit YajC